MNRDVLYRAIGDIDDDLIRDAAEAGGKKRRQPMLYRAVSLAACVCLICVSVLFGLPRDTVYFNEVSFVPSSKVNIPSGDRVAALSREELLVYYGLERLPTGLGDDLTLSEPSAYTVVRDQDDTVLYDTNVLHYGSSDRQRTVTVMLAKESDLPDGMPEEPNDSEIGGVSVVLTVSPQDTSGAMYRAEFEIDGVSVRVTANGLGENAFLDAVRALIRQL